MKHTYEFSQRLMTGQRAVFAQVSTPSPLIAEAIASHAWNGIVFDLQHGQSDLSSLVPLLQSVSYQGVTPLVRIAWNEPSSVMSALDAGAAGVICPLVNDRAEAERFVAAAMYPPAGIRSFGPYRAGIRAGVRAYASQSNDDVLTFAMIETSAGASNIDEIVSTPGLSGIYVGPSDLSRALGGDYGVDWSAGKVRDFIDEALRTTRSHGKIAGIYCDSASYAAQMLEIGFTYVVVGSELGYVHTQSEQILEILRPIVENRESM